MSSIEQSFQQHQPVTTTIKNILGKYPYSKQILQEFLQNADDSQAKTVKFLLDDAQFPKEKVYKSDDLHFDGSFFQGPALVVFNDGIMEPQDWNNLQRIGDSNKILDQSKIGKFGLGFNSCYHFSDVWSAASQSTIVFQDPRALQSRKFDFSDPDSTKKNEIALKIQSLQDQFLPLQLGENFEFIKKINIMPLFLKNVRNIELWERSTNNDFKIIASVTVESENILKPNESFISVCAKSTSNVSDLNELFQIQSQRVVVKHFESNQLVKTIQEEWNVASGFFLTKKTNSQQLEKLFNEANSQEGKLQKKKYVPWTAIAVKKSSTNSNENNEDFYFPFCFLPFGKDTRLPFHCHAFFDLTEDRANLRNNSEMNKEVNEWNDFLLKELSALFLLFLNRFRLDLRLVLNSLPTLTCSEMEIQTPWQRLAFNIYNQIINQKEKIFFHQNSDVHCSIQEMVQCQDLNTPISKLFDGLLAHHKINYLFNIDDRILQSFSNFKFEVPNLDQIFMQKILVSHQNLLSNESRDVCFQILDYLLSSQTVKENKTHLSAVKLLPFKNRFEEFGKAKFFYFTRNQSQQIKSLSTMLPFSDIENQFLDFELLQEKDDFKYQLWSKLESYLTTHYLQNQFGEASIKAIFSSHLNDWKKDEWWSFLNQFYPQFITMVGNDCPLIPTTLPSFVSFCTPKLVKLEAKFDFCTSVLQKFGFMFVPIQFQEKYGEISKSLLPLTPKLFFSNVDIHKMPVLKSFLFSLCVFKIIRNKKNLQVLNKADCVNLKRLFLSDQYWMNECILKVNRDVFQTMPIFFNHADNCLSLNDPDFWLPSSEFDEKLFLLKSYRGCVKVGNVDELKLLNSFDQKPMDWRTFHSKVISNFSIYHQFSTIGSWKLILDLILKQAPNFPDLTKIENSYIFPVSSTQNVDGNPLSSATLLKCSELFNPTNSLQFLAKINGYHFIDSTILEQHAPLLKKMKLRDSLQPTDILSIANKLVNENLLPESFYEQFFSLINSNISEYESILTKFGTIQFLPPMSQPKTFEGIDWFFPLQPGTTIPTKFSISQMKSFEMAEFCCGTKPILPFKISMTNLENRFKLNVVEDETLINQLSTLHSAISRGSISIESAEKMIAKIYEGLSDHFWNNSNLRNRLEKEFIWSGQCFVEKIKLILINEFEKRQLGESISNLKPHIYVFHCENTELRLKFQTFLKKVGISNEIKVEQLKLEIAKIQKQHQQKQNQSLDLIVVQNYIALLKLFASQMKAKKNNSSNNNNNLDFNFVTLLPDIDNRFQAIIKLVSADARDKSLIPNSHFILHVDLIPISLELNVSTIQNFHGKSGRIIDGVREVRQLEETHTKLKNLIQEYNQDQLISEMIQNADDAHATEIAFILDFQNYPTEKVIDKKMENLQGPALLVWNNSAFRTEDWDNICKLGGATKQDQSDKIGKFGYGLNVIYHLTDVPQVFSGEYLLYFDPHQYIDPSSAGKQLDLLNPKRYQLISDSLDPFILTNDKIKKWDTDSEYSQTIFRLPLRNSAGKIKDRPTSTDDVLKLFHDYQQNGFGVSSLLFLKHLKAIRFYTRKQPETLEMIYELTNSDSEKDEEYRKSFTVMPDQYIIKQNTISEKIFDKQHKLQPERISNFMTVVGFRKELLAQSSKLKCLPFASVSLLLKSDRKDWLPPKYLHCFLPCLGERLDLPLIVNGDFVLQQNRKSIVNSPHDKAQFEWNSTLIREIVVPAYLHALLELKNKILSNPKKKAKGKKSFDIENNFYLKYWPINKPNSFLGTEIFHQFYKVLATNKYELFSCSQNKLEIQWKSLVGDEFLFENQSDTYPEYVIKFVRQHWWFSFQIPNYIQQNLKDLQNNLKGFQLKEITSDLVIDAVSKSSKVDKINASVLFKVILYCLKHDKGQNKTLSPSSLFDLLCPHLGNELTDSDLKLFWEILAFQKEFTDAWSKSISSIPVVPCIQGKKQCRITIQDSYQKLWCNYGFFQNDGQPLLEILEEIDCFMLNQDILDKILAENYALVLPENDKELLTKKLPSYQNMISNLNQKSKTKLSQYLLKNVYFSKHNLQNLPIWQDVLGHHRPINDNRCFLIPELLLDLSHDLVSLAETLSQENEIFLFPRESLFSNTFRMKDAPFDQIFQHLVGFMKNKQDLRDSLLTKLFQNPNSTHLLKIADFIADSNDCNLATQFLISALNKIPNDRKFWEQIAQKKIAPCFQLTEEMSYSSKDELLKLVSNSKVLSYFRSTCNPNSFLLATHSQTFYVLPYEVDRFREFPENVSQHLQLKFQPDLKDVISELKIVISKCDKLSFQLESIYNYLQREISKKSEIQPLLSKIEFESETRGQFQTADKFCLGLSEDFPPILFRIPNRLNQFTDLLSNLGAKQQFSAGLCADLFAKEIGTKTTNITTLTKLFGYLLKEIDQPDEVKERNWYLPNSKGEFIQSRLLYFESPTFPLDEKIRQSINFEKLQILHSDFLQILKNRPNFMDCFNLKPLKITMEPLLNMNHSHLTLHNDLTCAIQKLSDFLPTLDKTISPKYLQGLIKFEIYKANSIQCALKVDGIDVTKTDSKIEGDIACDTQGGIIWLNEQKQDDEKLIKLCEEINKLIGNHWPQPPAQLLLFLQKSMMQSNSSINSSYEVDEKQVVGYWGEQQVDKFLKSTGKKYKWLNASVEVGDVDFILDEGTPDEVWIEVKATSDRPTFFISKQQFEFARSKKEKYHLYRVEGYPSETASITIIENVWKHIENGDIRLDDKIPMSIVQPSKHRREIVRD